LTDHTSHIVAAAFGPDGKTLAVASADGPTRLWDLTTRTWTHDFREGSSGLAFTPDGRFLARAVGATIRLWDVNGAKEGPAFDAPGGARVGTGAVAFRRDGKLLAVAGGDGVVRLGDPVTGKLTLALRIRPAPARVNRDGSVSRELVRGPLLAFRPDGQGLAAV